MPYAKGDGPSVVIALGGNALGNSPQEQLELVKNTAKHIVDMIADGVNVVVSHGNGPQVGMINNAFAYAAANDGKTPEMPLPEAGAMSQGYIGYQLSQAILNDLKARGIDRSVANVITQTVVNPEDPAFQNPTKPVGAFMTEEEAKAKAAETGWTFKEDAGRGWRQVVASPKPERIVEFDAVKDLVDNGYIVVSTGGGGVPVFETDKGYEGVPAVIDKDRSSAKLAADFGADMLVILTAVEKVCINFNKPDQEELSTMTVAEAREYIAQGQFAPGSMLPKVEACIEYVEAYPEGKALITSLECAAAGLRDCRPRIAHGSRCDTSGRMARARELVRRAAEGVGGDDIASGFQIGRMHGSHDIRMGKVPNIRRFTRREARALQHGAHCAVKKKQLPFKQVL